MIKQSENKMIGERINKDELTNQVWICVSCNRYKIQPDKPQDCACHNPIYVVDLTKRIE